MITANDVVIALLVIIGLVTLYLILYEDPIKRRKKKKGRTSDIVDKVEPIRVEYVNIKPDPRKRIFNSLMRLDPLYRHKVNEGPEGIVFESYDFEKHMEEYAEMVMEDPIQSWTLVKPGGFPYTTFELYRSDEGRWWWLLLEKRHERKDAFDHYIIAVSPVEYESIEDCRRGIIGVKHSTASTINIRWKDTFDRRKAMSRLGMKKMVSDGLAKF